MSRSSYSIFLLAASLLGVAMAMAVTACGDDEVANVEEAESIELTLSEFDIEPDGPDVDAGVIELEISNEGDEEHALAIETSDDEIDRTERIPPGESRTLKLDFRPGKYKFYDPLGDNREEGMEGTLTVKRRTETETETDTDTDTETDTVKRTEEDVETVTQPRRTVTEERTVTETETESGSGR